MLATGAVGLQPNVAPLWWIQFSSTWYTKVTSLSFWTLCISSDLWRRDCKKKKKNPPTYSCHLHVKAHSTDSGICFHPYIQTLQSVMFAIIGGCQNNSHSIWASCRYMHKKLVMTFNEGRTVIYCQLSMTAMRLLSVDGWNSGTYCKLCGSLNTVESWGRFWNLGECDKMMMLTFENIWLSTYRTL